MMQTNIFIAISIAILYPYFFNKLSDVLMQKQRIKEECDIPKYIDKKTGKKYHHQPFYIHNNDNSDLNLEENPEYQGCEKKLARIDTTQFYILMIAGVLGVIIGSFIPNTITSLGISLGGLLTILYATYIYWHRMDEYMKLGLTGSSLVILIYVSIRNDLIKGYFKGVM